MAGIPADHNGTLSIYHESDVDLLLGKYPAG